MNYVTLDLIENRALVTADLGFTTGMLHPDRVAAWHDLLFVESGAWPVWEEDQPYDLRAGDVLLLYQGRHHYGQVPCRNATRWAYVHFPECAGDQFHPANTGVPAAPGEMQILLPVHLSARGHPRVPQLFRDIAHCFWSSLQPNRQRARILLIELLVELARIAGRQTDNGQASPIERVVRQIEEEPGQNFSLQQLQTISGMSRRMLTRRFREVMGKSVRQFQLEHRIKLASSLLLHNPGIRLKEVALMLGFFDEFHFSKAFKQIAGTSPSRFRRSSS